MWEDFQSLYAGLNGAEGAATIVVATIALIGAIAGVITSYIVAGRSVYINSITAERSKWIEKLRVNLAAHSAGLAAVAFRVIVIRHTDNTDEILGLRDQLEKLNHTASVIQLQLNPWGEIDRNILAMINGIVTRETTSPNLIDRADKLLIAHAQWLLKAEWERVKFEARSPVHRLWNCRAAALRLREYKRWADEEGAIAGILAEFALERAKPTNRPTSSG